MNYLAWSITYLGYVASVAINFFIVRLIVQAIKGERRFNHLKAQELLTVLLCFLLLGIVSFCIYSIPDILFEGLSWHYIEISGPISMKYCAISLEITFVFFYLYLVLARIFRDAKRSVDYTSMIGLSIINGFANTFSIFLINEAVRRGTDSARELIGFFICTLLLRIVGQKVIRSILTKAANDIVYEKRIGIIRQILRAPHNRFEQMESGKIEAGLNNDTTVIHTSITVIINMATSMVSLIFCYVYLSVLSLEGLLISILATAAASGIFYYWSSIAKKLLKKARSLENVFFKFISNLIRGHKTLILHRSKRREYEEDMRELCDDYRDKNYRAQMMGVNVIITGETVIMLVIGTIVFLLPEIIPLLERVTLRNYAFVFMHMTRPVSIILNNIHRVIAFRISWNRIIELQRELSRAESGEPETDHRLSIAGDLHIKLEGVTYYYDPEKKEGFSLGPLDCEFRSGEITYITGGNGSGKTTLGKIFTGLYTPDAGTITVNGLRLNGWNLGEFYSVVFSDYHLFEKMYGIEYENKMQLIKDYLCTLRIEDKLTIEDGVFSTIDLSSGQRKRLALLLAYLEDRPVYFFDEWAADQDPEFRQYFYEILLPALKANGKCVIAITHDDRYFSLADRIIDMELGKIIDKHEVKHG